MLRARTNASHFIAAPVSAAGAELEVHFTAPSAATGLALPLLHIGELRAAPGEDLIVESDSWEDAIAFPQAAFGVLFSVPPNSRCRLSINGSAGVIRLCHDNGADPEFAVGAVEAFFERAEPCVPPEPTGLSTGAVIGIAVGAVGFVAAVVVAVVVWRRKRAAAPPVAKYRLTPEERPDQAASGRSAPSAASKVF
jgi:hypothetical protein